MLFFHQQKMAEWRSITPYSVLIQTAKPIIGLWQKVFPAPFPPQDDWAANHKITTQGEANGVLFYLLRFLNKAKEPKPSRAIVAGSGIDIAPLNPLPPA